MRQLTCLRCGTQMQFAMQQKFQMGEHGFFLGDLSHLLSGALELEVYYCPSCGKAEFFVPEQITAYSDAQLPQTKCPRCGKSHDFDYPKCPYCGYSYYRK